MILDVHGKAAYAYTGGKAFDASRPAAEPHQQYA